MTESICKPTKQSYASEARYIDALLRHNQNFDELLSSVPVGQDRVRQGIIQCYHTEPELLLDRGKLAELKEVDSDLWSSIISIYMSYLHTRIGGI